MSEKFFSGLAIRYLPGICFFAFEQAHQKNPELTPIQYAQRAHDTGEISAFRTYPINKNPYVFISDKESFRRKYSITNKITIPVMTHKAIYLNNQAYYSTIYGGKITPDTLDSTLLGVPLEMFLSTYWAILELVDLKEISPTDQNGKVTTNIGVLDIISA